MLLWYIVHSKSSSGVSCELVERSVLAVKDVHDRELRLVDIHDEGQGSDTAVIKLSAPVEPLIFK